MEANIIHENGYYWVKRVGSNYHAMVSGLTHSVSDSTYADSSLAIARVNYLSRTHTEGKNLERASRLVRNA